MGIRGINPLVFTAFVANQMDPALNIGGRPAAPRPNANSQDGDDVSGARGDQADVNELDSAVPGLQGEETQIDASQTQLDPSRLRQEVGHRSAAEHGQHLDIIT